MLTDSEKKWLEQRNAVQFMVNQYRVPGTRDGYRIRKIQTADWRDAAEFEARVAVELSILPEDVHPCPYGATNRCSYDDCGNLHLGCRRSILKYARLKVEEEMNADT